MLLRDEIVKLLSQLLDKRSQDYLKLDKTLQPMSDTEVDLLCLLLEVNSLFSIRIRGNLSYFLALQFKKISLLLFSLSMSVLHDAFSIV